jgi:hypothetical protein
MPKPRKKPMQRQSAKLMLMQRKKRMLKQNVKPTLMPRKKRMPKQNAKLMPKPRKKPMQRQKLKPNVKPKNLLPIKKLNLRKLRPVQNVILKQKSNVLGMCQWVRRAPKPLHELP